MKRLAVVLALCASVVGCGRHETVVYQQPAQPVAMVAQPVVVQNPDPMTGVIAGMAIGAILSNGMRYDGHNGYYDSHYRGPSRTITRVTNVTNVVNKTSATTPANPVVATPAKAAPVVAAAPVATPAKVKNPGDAAADHARSMDARKAAVTAQREQRIASKPSGFNSMSKSASSRSSSSGSRRK